MEGINKAPIKRGDDNFQRLVEFSQKHFMLVMEHKTCLDFRQAIQV